MKKTGIAALLTLLLAAALLLILSACAGGGDDTGTPAQNAPETQTAETPAPAASLTAEEKLAIAKDYIDSPVEDLLAAIGDPDDRDYAPSCMGSGDDGNLYYDGFIVYTYREGDSEVVIDVE
ncbi:MAG: hypothetical protein J6V24_01495 [Clostridia bacterium]|nr:hypothetical protein [Clostridia bacterium]MBO7403609.1 hypothetical protein [Clostridia bacterium]